MAYKINDKAFQLEQDILQLIQDAQYAMSNPDGMTDSDLQGQAMMIARRYFGEPIIEE
jgi:hypothetical protein